MKESEEASGSEVLTVSGSLVVDAAADDSQEVDKT